MGRGITKLIHQLALRAVACMHSIQNCALSNVVSGEIRLTACRYSDKHHLGEATNLRCRRQQEAIERTPHRLLFALEWASEEQVQMPQNFFLSDSRSLRVKFQYRHHFLITGV